MNTLYTQNIRTSTSLLNTANKIHKTMLLPVNVSKSAGCVTNSGDPDQTPRSAASDQGLHCLLRPVFPNTYSKYGNFIKSNPLGSHPGSAPGSNIKSFPKIHFLIDVL